MDRRTCIVRNRPDDERENYRVLTCHGCGWRKVVPHESAGAETLRHLKWAELEQVDPGGPWPDDPAEPEPSVWGAVVGGAAIIMALLALLLILIWLKPA